jgi:asparagine synthase (glutamine-hydrolysing)
MEGNILTWDGRLDNPSEVAHRIGGGASPSAADPALVLGLYETAGLPGLGMLVGDWSAAIWDAAAQSVILASDCAGVRPLYYFHSHGSLLWSSSLSDLVSWTSADYLDADYVIDFLTGGIAIGRTPYRGIRPVPPGKALRFHKSGMEATTLWQLDPGRRVRFRDDREYADRFRSLFEEAVRVRIPHGASIHAELSGGLDSSSIVCMAHKLIGENRVSPASLTAVTYSHPGSPDGKYATLVHRSCSIASMQLEVATYPYISGSSLGNAAPAWWAPRNAELARRMQSAGSSVLLSGQMGDLVMANWLDESDRVADLLRRGDLLAACSQARAWSALLHVPIPWILWRAIRLNLPFLSPPEEDVGAIAHDRSDSLSAAARQRTRALAEDRRSPSWRQAPIGRRKHFRLLYEILEGRTLEVPESLYPIHYTHPYIHRPLLEFMLSIPPEIVCGIGEPRRLMRLALAGIVPNSVLRRRSKASFAAVFASAMRPLALGLVDAPRRILLASRGYIDPANLEIRLRRFLNGLDCNEPQLRRIILLEYWLRAHPALAESAPLPR